MYKLRAHLDREAGLRVMEALRTLTTQHGAGLLVATHDERLTALADRVLRLEDGALAG